MKKLFLYIFFVFSLIQNSAFAQNDSCSLQISLLTCTPGADAYSAFGHTAIRVRDANQNLDRVYNYGTFDDSDPLFYWKFTQGIMNYELSSYDMIYFIREYQYFNRGVTEQVLNLTCEHAHAIFQSLQQNDLPENRVYQYHFTKNNCTSKADEVIFQHIGKQVLIKDPLPEKIPTYRELLHEYLDESHQVWLKFGIDLILSSKVDVKVDSVGFRFLPKNLMSSLENATIQREPFVKQTNTIIEASGEPFEETDFTPAIAFSILLMLYVSIQFVQKRWSIILTKFFNFLIYFVLGLIGTLLTLLWFIRVDEVCENNYNLLWAIPTHLIACIFLFSKKKWVAYYFKITMILAMGTGILWFIIPQNFNSAVIPILGIIVASSYIINKTQLQKNLENRGYGI